MNALVRNLLKVLNPFIWCINVFRYFAHLDSQGPRIQDHGTFVRITKEYEPYDFSKDIKYF